ncbi:MAG TPA: hypothetical protein VFV50_04290, partial [Bdellovibrionales bacterium]|nr:hypothetical protein [Bdellovibrionales bacterium]
MDLATELSAANERAIDDGIVEIYPKNNSKTIWPEDPDFDELDSGEIKVVEDNTGNVRVFEDDGHWQVEVGLEVDEVFASAANTANSLDEVFASAANTASSPDEVFASAANTANSPDEVFASAGEFSDEIEARPARAPQPDLRRTSYLGEASGDVEHGVDCDVDCKVDQDIGQIAEHKITRTK